MGNAPTGLPGAPAADAQEARADATVCPDCDQQGRVVSNSSGVNVFCNKCKKHWPISSTARAQSIPLSAPRGLSKQTIVEPDWSLAEAEMGDVSNEQVGPKRK